MSSPAPYFISQAKSLPYLAKFTPFSLEAPWLDVLLLGVPGHKKGLSTLVSGFRFQSCLQLVGTKCNSNLVR